MFECVVSRDCGLAGQLEEVHADEDDNKADDEGYCVHRVVSVDALEENERRDDGGRREADVI